MFLVLLETSANQDFIFATNKLRENVGASELTWRVGTQFALDAVEAVGGSSLFDRESAKLRRNLLDVKLNPPIDGENSNGLEVVQATSGKALVLVKDEATGKEIVRLVTARALRDAPGCDVRGAVVEVPNDGLDSVPRAVKACHRSLELARGRVPGPESRFLRIPVVAPCTTSGLPASRWDPRAKNICSEVARRKREAGPDGHARMGRGLCGTEIRFNSPSRSTTSTSLERLTGWLSFMRTATGWDRSFCGFTSSLV